MSFTYDLNLPTEKDHIRYALGDIDPENPLLQDETILAKLQAFGYGEALAQLAEGLASQFAQEPDSFTSDGMRISWTERVANWRALAKSARELVVSPAEASNNAHIIITGQTTIQSTHHTGFMTGFRSW